MFQISTFFNFNKTLTNDVVSFEQPDPGIKIIFIVYTCSTAASLKAVHVRLGANPYMADVTSEGPDQTALKCSLTATV